MTTTSGSPFVDTQNPLIPAAVTEQQQQQNKEIKEGNGNDLDTTLDAIEAKIEIMEKLNFTIIPAYHVAMTRYAAGEPLNTSVAKERISNWEQMHLEVEQQLNSLKGLDNDKMLSLLQDFVHSAQDI
ncbi:hypothetical protein DAMA08_017870 [Martiniozyma asiatica (nom. inval.)]|nr:hypothetical protein DAMA08_017870 [Martiniozyma asiatica]